MRNFDEGLISYAYFMGPFLYGLNKYVKENPTFGFSKNMTLYRYIKCTILDFYLYIINLKHIICFPSITSTTINEKYNPSEKSQDMNGIDSSKGDIVNVKMILNYQHIANNISPGIIICDNKGKDGKYLSILPKEGEVILFPFTFARIKTIQKDPSKTKSFIINLDIVNRNGYIENILNKYVEQRFLYSELDKKINKIK